MKKLLCLLLIFTLLLATPVYANEQQIQVYVNDTRQSYTIHPIKMNNAVLVPIRSVFTSLDIAFSYDAATRTITAEEGDVKVQLILDNPSAKINNKTLTLSQPPTSINNYTYVPLRFISEAFGAKVNWNASEQSVRIDYGSKTTLFNSIRQNDFNSYKKILAANPSLADQAAEHVIFKRNNIEWLKLALHHGADPKQSLRNAISWDDLEAVTYILDNKLFNKEDKYVTNYDLTLIGEHLHESTFVKLIYKNSEDHTIYKYEKQGLLEITQALYDYGITPTSTDLIPAIITYHDSTVQKLELLLNLGADPNGKTVEVVTLTGPEETNIHFSSLYAPQDPDSLVPVIVSAYRRLSWSPGSVEYAKFNLLVKHGASIAPLSSKQLDRLAYLYENSEYPEMYEKIQLELQSRL